MVRCKTLIPAITMASFLAFGVTKSTPPTIRRFWTVTRYLATRCATACLRQCGL